MSLEEQLRSAKMKLANIQESYPRELKKYREEIRQREAQNEPPETLNRFKAWVDEHEITTANLIAAMEQEIANLEDKISGAEHQRHLQAVADLEALKEPARAQWIERGGAPEDFETIWPQFKIDLLKQQILNDLNPFPPKRDKE